ncbi:hypothetical protein EDB81DRAFT_766677 [Dactylonectria macrodidyma]|uniref:Uncharacterized protein n=1 Tax=Dactylonectria macrodidyma TaxID=307937 RepID=A0A9P9DK11_9HYPO|nr:hypothetical protein EDB81DRAFT_766677 [Dactylonectria macrodidyma]
MHPYPALPGIPRKMTICFLLSKVALLCWIDDTREVNSHVSLLCDEITALSRVLKAISNASVKAPQVIIAEIDPDGQLEDCCLVSARAPSSSIDTGAQHPPYKRSPDDQRETLARVLPTLEAQVGQKLPFQRKLDCQRWNPVYCRSSTLEITYPSDYDEDTDLELSKSLEELTLESQMSGDYKRTESFFGKDMDCGQASKRSSTDITKMRISLACPCMQQEKWINAEGIILPMAFEQKASKVMLFRVMHALALILRNSDLEAAYRYCKRALWGKRKTLDGNSTSDLIVCVNYDSGWTSAAYALLEGPGSTEEWVISRWAGTDGPLYGRLGSDISDAPDSTGHPKEGIKTVDWLPMRTPHAKHPFTYASTFRPIFRREDAVDASADFLRCLRLAIYSYLEEELGIIFTPQKKNVHWCFTVRGFRDCQNTIYASINEVGYLYNYDDTCISLLSISEAAIIHTKASGLLQLRICEGIIVVDLGETAVEATTWGPSQGSFAWVARGSLRSPSSQRTELKTESIEEDKLMAVIENFAYIVQGKIDKLRLCHDSETCSRLFTRALDDFRNRIKHDFIDDGKSWAVDVGTGYDYPAAGIEGGLMIFTNEEVRSRFTPILACVTGMIHDQVVKARRKNEEAQYISSQVSLHMVQPVDSDMVVVMGAALRATKHGYVDQNFVEKFFCVSHYCVNTPEDMTTMLAMSLGKVLEIFSIQCIGITDPDQFATAENGLSSANLELSAPSLKGWIMPL